jgi:DNA-binding MurR/RpiR family transcriptional regulator
LTTPLIITPLRSIKPTKEYPFVGYLFTHSGNQSIMMDTVKEFRQVNIHHIGFTTVNNPLCRFYRLVLAPSGTETVTVRRKMRIENRFQQEF